MWRTSWAARATGHAVPVMAVTLGPARLADGWAPYGCRERARQECPIGYFPLPGAGAHSTGAWGPISGLARERRWLSTTTRLRCTTRPPIWRGGSPATSPTGWPPASAASHWPARPCGWRSTTSSPPSASTRSPRSATVATCRWTPPRRWSASSSTVCPDAGRFLRLAAETMPDGSPGARLRRDGLAPVGARRRGRRPPARDPVGRLHAGPADLGALLLPERRGGRRAPRGRLPAL